MRVAEVQPSATGGRGKPARVRERRRSWMQRLGSAWRAWAVLAAVAAVAAGTRTAAADVEAWEYLLFDGAGAPGREAASFTYDSRRQRVLVFGGADAYGPRNDLWAIESPEGAEAAWQALEPSGKPPSARLGHVAVFDERHDRLVVFGGWSAAKTRVFGDVAFLDLEGEPRWSSPLVRGSGPRLADAGAVYDPAGQRMIVFGGTDERAEFNDVWSLALPDDAAPEWTKLHPAGAAPEPRSSFVAAYSQDARTMLVFGGWHSWTQGLFGDVGALDLTPGSERWIAQRDPGDPAPVARRSSVGIYDPLNDRLVVVGGWNDIEKRLADAWSYDRAAGRWRQLSPGGGPSKRGYAMGAYDPRNARLLYFGGHLEQFRYAGDVWAMPLGGVVPTLTPSPTPTSRWTPTATATATGGGATETPSATPKAPGRPTLSVAYLPRAVFQVREPPASPTDEPCLLEEREPNDKAAHAIANPPPCHDIAVPGRLPEGDPEDVYRFELPRPATIDVDLYNIPPRVDYDLYLYDVDHRQIAKSAAWNETPEHVTIDLPAGRYFARVYPADSRRSDQIYKVRWFMR